MFGAPKPPFGQQANTGTFGFGQQANATTPFGGTASAFGKPAAGGFGQPTTFGQQNNTLFGGNANQGAGLFGASTSTAFGQAQPQNTGFGGFGAQQPQQPTSTLFGGATAQPQNTSLFGSTNTTFGAQKPTGFGFASTQQPATGLFGQTQPSTSTAPSGFFGQQPQTGGGIFGATQAPAPAFGMAQQQENRGTSIAKYNPTMDSDTILVKGNQSTVNTKQHCITFMKEYAERSLEELRLDDYVANRKGPQPGGLFSSQQQAGGIFGSTQQNTGLFGQTQQAQPAGGGLFGAQANPLGGGFGQTTNAFGATTQANNSLFAKPFGTTTAQSGFGFGGATSTTATPFGQAKPAFGATTGASTGIFGQTAPAFGQPAQQTPGFGSTFGQQPQQQPQQQQQQNSLFGGATQQQSAFGAAPNTGFGGFGATTSTASTGIFGKPATGFGVQPATGFGTAASTAPTLGGFGQPAQGGLFGNSLAKPQTNFTGFGQQQTSVAPMGTTGFGTGTSFFGQNTQQKPGGLFGTAATTQAGGLFGATPNFGTSTLGGGLTGFGNTTSFGGLGTQQNTFGAPQQAAPPIHQQILSLAASPYGDNPIYKDLKPSVTASEEALKVTNPAAQKAMLESLSNKFKVSPAVSNPVRVKPVGHLTKKSLFDGLEEYDASVAENFTLKPSAKRLIIKPKNSPAMPSTTRPLQQSNISVDESLKFKPVINQLSSSSFERTDLNTSEKFDNVIPNTAPIDNGRRVSWLQTAQFDKAKENQPRLSETIMETTLKDLVTASSEKPMQPRVSIDNSTIAEPSRSFDVESSLELTRGGNQISSNDSLFNLSAGSPPQKDTPAHPTGIVLTRQGYYTIPTLDDITALMDEHGRCIVPNFTIGRHGYGNVYFNESFDVQGLNFDEIVHFRHKEIIIYPDDENKPAIGQGLNRKAQVTLDQVWPIDKTLHEPIKDPERLEAMSFEAKLRRVCDKSDTRFLEYRPDTGSWVFKVDHFSKYGLTDSDEEESAPTDPKQLKLGDVNDQGKKLEDKEMNKENGHEPMKLLGGVAQKPSFFGTKEDTHQKKLGGFLSEEDFSLDYIQGPDSSKMDFLSTSASIAMDMDVNSHKLQLMKASFFADDDYDGRSVVSDTSESCGSADQIVPDRRFARSNRNYLSSAALSSISEDQQMDDDILTSVGSAKSSIDKGLQQQVPIISTVVSKMRHPEGPKSAPLVIKPQVFYEGGVSIAIPLKTSYLYNVKSTKFDPIFFNGRRFKAGWGPYSKLQMLKATDLEEDTKSHRLHISKHCFGRMDYDYTPNLINRVQFPSNDGIRNFQETIIPHLEIELRHDKILRNPDMECPYFTANGGLKGLFVHTEVAQKNAHMSDLEGYMGSVWSLCTSLWGEREELEGQDDLSHNVVMFRREMFSEWIEDVITDAEMLEIKSQTENSYLGQLLNLLFSHKVSNACEVAMSNDDYNLSLLLAQLSSGPTVKQLIQHQLALWQDVEADKFIEEKRLRAFMIIAGIPIFHSNQGLINIYEGMDWIKSLAFHLWYICSPTSSITDALLAYEKTLETTEIEEIRPNPPYMSSNSKQNTEKPLMDLRYHILHLFSKKTHPMDRLLNPATHTLDPMDFRLSWLLLQTLESIGYTHTSELVRSQIHTSFADQLENYGLWQWAIYVLLHINQRTRREAAIKKILLRHIQFEFDQDYIEIENFIVDKLGIPETWIYFAKAVKARSDGNYDDQAKFLLHAKEWAMAHEVIMEHIAPDAILNDKIPYLKMLLKEFKEPKKISNWITQGKILSDFIEINETVENLKNCSEDDIESALEELKSKFGEICSVIKFFPCPTAKHRLCQSEIAQRLAFLIRSFYATDNSFGQRCSLLKLSLEKLPLSPEYAKQELKHLLSAFLDEQLRIE